MMLCVCQVELLGQELCDYVHPCDHHQLASLVPDTALDTDQDVEVQYTPFLSSHCQKSFQKNLN